MLAQPARSIVRTQRLGLLGMRERAVALDGRLEIESQPGAGTKILLARPLDDDHVQE
jgi:two-component system sensor histidine kinase DegS